MYESNDQVKLLLEALQMSVSSCMQHPELPTLQPQMVGRLMAANHSTWVAVSLHSQYDAPDMLSTPYQASLSQLGCNLCCAAF